MAYRGPEIKPLADQLTAKEKQEIEALMADHKITCLHEGIKRWRRAKGYIPGRLTLNDTEKEKIFARRDHQ